MTIQIQNRAKVLIYTNSYFVHLKGLHAITMSELFYNEEEDYSYEIVVLPLIN